MGILSPRQIVQAAQAAGFRGQSLTTAVAIALAESGGDPRAVGTNGPTDGCPAGSTDRGLWQINSCYHPEVTADCTFSLGCAASAAYRISSSGLDFSPWSTFTSGAYKQFLATAASAVAQLPPTPPIPRPGPPLLSSELKPWPYLSQITMPVEAGYPAQNRPHDCFEACAAMLHQYYHGEYWSEDHILDIMYPNGHTGNTLLDRATWYLTVIEGWTIREHVPTATSQGRWFLNQNIPRGYPVIQLGSITVNGVTNGHFSVCVGCTPSNVVIAGPAFGTRQVLSYRDNWQFAQQLLIAVQQKRY